MKIAILIDLLVPGGVQKAAIEETHYLRKLGHKTQLFCLTRTNYYYQYHDLLQGLSINYLSDQNPPPFRSTRKLPFFSFLTTNHLLNPFFVRRYKRLTGFNLVISHGTTTCLTAMAIKRKFGIPYLAFIWDPMGFILHTVYNRTPLRHISPFLDLITSYLERRIVRGARYVITPSNLHKKVLDANYAINSVIIPPGHDFITKVKRNKPSYILGYSRWQKEKHPEFFLKLARITDIPIVIAGLWTDKEELRKFKTAVRKEKLKIKITGTVQHKDIPSLARKAIVWVHPHFEAFGMPGLELAANGVPIIILKGSGITELFQDGIHGFFPSDRKQMIDAVLKLTKDPNRTQAMGRAAAQVAKNYTWKTHTKKLEKMIEKDRPRSVIVINNGYVTDKTLGGGDRYVQEVTARIKNQKIIVITPKIGLTHWNKPPKKPVQYKILKPSIFDNHESPFAIFIAYVVRALETTKILKLLTAPDIIFSTSDLLPDVLPAFLFKRSHPQVKWDVHIGHLALPPGRRKGNLFVNTAAFILQRISLLLMRSSDRLLIDNPALGKKLKALGIPKAKMEVHPGGVDVRSISNYQSQGKSMYEAVYVGRLTPHKGVLDLIPIWKEVVKHLPAASLAVIGEGAEKMKLKLTQEIKKANLEGRITLLGFIPQRRGRSMPLFDILKNTKVLLFTDHEAGFGLSVAEAMAAGIPVVAYDLPIFGNTYKMGFLKAPLKDTKAFAVQVIKLLQNQRRYRKISKDAAEQAEEFNWSKIAERFKQTLLQT